MEWWSGEQYHAISLVLGCFSRDPVFRKPKLHHSITPPLRYRAGGTPALPGLASARPHLRRDLPDAFAGDGLHDTGIRALAQGLTGNHLVISPGQHRDGN